MVNHDNYAPLPTVLQHQKRPQWGLSFLLWEIENKQSYLFENGEVRTLASEFSRLMVPIEAPAEHVSAMLHRLEPQIRALQESRSTTPQPAAKKVSPLFTLDEQWAFFLNEYAGGFSGDVWRKKVRGEGLSKTLKRHRDPLFAAASKSWQAGTLRSMLDQGDYGGLWACIGAVLCKSDILPAPQLKLLKSPPAGTERMLAETVFGLLHGEGELNQRLDSFVTALRKASGKKSTWQLATAVLGLFTPQEHICVRSSSFAEQAKSLQLKVKRGNEVSVRAYEAYLQMALEIKAELEARGHSPRDLMDIHDFIRVTMSPTARKLMAAKSVETGSETELSALEHVAGALSSAEAEAPSGVNHVVPEDDGGASANVSEEKSDQDAA